MIQMNVMNQMTNRINNLEHRVNGLENHVEQLEDSWFKKLFFWKWK